MNRTTVLVATKIALFLLVPGRAHGLRDASHLVVHVEYEMVDYILEESRRLPICVNAFSRHVDDVLFQLCELVNT